MQAPTWAGSGRLARPLEASLLWVPCFEWGGCSFERTGALQKLSQGLYMKLHTTAKTAGKQFYHCCYRPKFTNTPPHSACHSYMRQRHKAVASDLQPCNYTQLVAEPFACSMQRNSSQPLQRSTQPQQAPGMWWGGSRQPHTHQQQHPTHTQPAATRTHPCHPHACVTISCLAAPPVLL